MKLSPILPIALAGALIAGAAQAQSLEPSVPPAHFDVHLTDLSPGREDVVAVARPIGVAAKPTPDLADPLDPLARPKPVIQALDSEVFATTAVDHRFGKRDDITGSLGLLCGRQPEHADSGGAAAYGVDPHGRFVGAKLSLAF